MKSFQLALVTGASTGLGKALCQALAYHNIPLLLVARDEEKLKQLAKSLSVPTHIYSVDLSLPYQRQKFLEWLKEKGPDLIINNAGSGLYGPALSHPTIEQSAMLELNVQALLEITLESARTLLQQKRPGTILNVSSVAGFFLYPSHSVYAASKACVNNLSESLDYELKPHSIRILSTCPGMIDTDFSLHASGGASYKKKTFLTMTPEKVAQIILKQINRGKAIEIIDWRYRCLYALSKLLPKRLKMKIMNATLKSMS